MRTLLVRLGRSAIAEMRDGWVENALLTRCQLGLIRKLKAHATRIAPEIRLRRGRSTRPYTCGNRAQFSRQAERGTAEAGRIQAKDLHIRAFRWCPFALRSSGAQPEQPRLAEQKLPDKSHNLCNREAMNRTVPDRRDFVGNCNRLRREDADRASDDGDSRLSRNVAQLQLYSTIRQQLYAATGHPKEVEAAKERAAM